MERKKIVAGNWKMNKSLQEAKLLVEMIMPQVNDFDEVIKIIIPAFPYLHPVSELTSTKSNFYVSSLLLNPIFMLARKTATQMPAAHLRAK
jgi:triosephosphate isomerase (TIM)